MGLPPHAIHQLFSLCYVVAAAAIFLQAPRHVRDLWRGLKVEPQCACEAKAPPRRLHLFLSSGVIPFEPRSASCEECPLREAAMKAADAAPGGENI